MTRSASRLTFAALLLVAAVAMVAQLGCVPHLHAGAEAGIYNADHDLTLLATLAGYGILSDATPAPALDAVSRSIVPSVEERAATRSAHSGDSRAPPAA
jgi:hypothetical protein